MLHEGPTTRDGPDQALIGEHLDSSPDGHRGQARFLNLVDDVTEVLAAELAQHCFDAGKIGICWRRTACTRSVCPVQAAPDKGSCLVKLGPAGYC